MIYTYLITAAVVLVSMLIQGHSSFDVIRIAGVKPDLLFVITVYMGYSFGSFHGEITGFASGLLHDSISNSPLGLMTLPKLAIGFVVGMFGRSVLKGNMAAILVLIFAASIAKGIITLFLCYIFHQGMISSVIHVILPEAFYNAVLSPMLFFIFDKIYQGELQREGYL